MSNASQKTAMNMALKVAIIQRGHTQREVARRAGLSELRLSQLVTGRFLPTAEERRAIAKALRCRQSELFAVVERAVSA